MENDKDQVLVENYWNPKFYPNRPAGLYAHQLGWQLDERTMAGSDDPYDIFILHINMMPYDLALHLVEEDVMLFCDNHWFGVYILKPRPDWDGKYLDDKYDPHHSNMKLEDEPIYEYEDTNDLWEKFRYKGKDLRYLIEHSVVSLSH